jgi:N-acetyl sugar amidotransferase
MQSPNIQVCTRCVYDENVPRIDFDEDGVCNYCSIHDAMEKTYPIGSEGEKILSGMVKKIKQSAKGKKYDCVVGVSGGCDSSYLLVRMVELGLNPLAVHFDNTWNSEVATQNIYKVTQKLGVDLHTHVVNNKEYDGIIRAFLEAGAKDVDAPTDLGLASVLYHAASKHGLKYIIEGHSFRTEGIAPLDWSYMDGRYISSVHQLSNAPKFKTYPNMSIQKFIYWVAFKGIKRFRPLYFMDYDKDFVKKRLAEEYDWEWYGGHHLENRITAFCHLLLFPKRWNSDLRLLGHAALVRSKQLSKNDALESLAQPVECPDELIDLVKKRLDYTDSDIERVLALPHKTWRDFPNYKKTFEFLRPLFFLLVKSGRIPESFYMKFCFPNELGEGGETS